MKLLIFILLAYLAYRVFFAGPTISSPPPREEIPQEPDSGEYTDYEEVD